MRLSTSSLRVLCQRQASREDRDRPRAARRPAACRRPATAAGCHTGSAAGAALPMPTLRRPHDRHRGLRSRLRAEVAANPERVRHVMSQTEVRAAALPFPCAARRRRRSLSTRSGHRPPPPVDTLQLRSGRFFHSLARRRVRACSPRRPSVSPPSKGLFQRLAGPESTANKGSFCCLAGSF